MKLAVVVGDNPPYPHSHDGNFRIVNTETGEVLDGVAEARWFFEPGLMPKLEVTIYGVVCWSLTDWERCKVHWLDGQRPASGMGTTKRVVGIEG